MRNTGSHEGGTSHGGDGWDSRRAPRRGLWKPVHSRVSDPDDLEQGASGILPEGQAALDTGTFG